MLQNNVVGIYKKNLVKRNISWVQYQQQGPK